MLLGDGSYACVRLAWTCLGHHVTRISRLRLDVQLYALPDPIPAGKRGRNPKKVQQSQYWLKAGVCEAIVHDLREVLRLA